MEYLQVRNWKKFQHYTRRNPPWIKLHTAILDDYKFSQLTVAERLVLILTWTLAGRLDNKIPHCNVWLASRLGLRARDVRIDVLIKNGWLEPYDASNVLAKCYTRDRDRDRAETETETETDIKARAQKPARTSPPKKTNPISILTSRGVSEQVAKDYLELRKGKRAALTETAIKRIESEATKAGLSLQVAIEECCARGWQGFKADWYLKGRDNGGKQHRGFMTLGERNDAITKQILEDIDNGK